MKINLFTYAAGFVGVSMSSLFFGRWQSSADAGWFFFMLITTIVNLCFRIET